MTYEFARGLVNFLAPEVVQPFAGWVINLVCSDEGDVLSVAVEYFSVHQITSSLAPRLFWRRASSDLIDPNALSAVAFEHVEGGPCVRNDHTPSERE